MTDLAEPSPYHRDSQAQKRYSAGKLIPDPDHAGVAVFMRRKTGREASVPSE
jgi:hypothetical protein